MMMTYHNIKQTVKSVVLIFVFTIVFANGSFASITKKALVKRCEQSITQKLGGSVNVLHSNIASLCETINLIPNDNIDDELASWIESTYGEQVNGDNTGPMDIDSVRHRLEVTTQLAKIVCPLITHDGLFYKAQGKHLIAVSREIRTGIFSIVKNRIDQAKSIHLDVSNASPSDSVKIVSEAFDLRVNNFTNDSDWKEEYSNRIESQIISLTLVRAIYFSTFTRIAHDQDQYSVNLFTLILHIDKGTQDKLGRSLHQYSSVKAQIQDFLDKTIYIKGDVAYIDWRNSSNLLRDYESIMWINNYKIPFDNNRRKIIFIVTPVQNMSELLQKSDLDVFKSMLWKDRDNTKLLQSLNTIVSSKG